MKRIATIVLSIAVLCSVAGCGKYYRVTDTTTNTAYYTKKLKKQSGGAVRFTDQSTGATVTLQSSKVEKIKKSAYRAGVSD
jgi:hypothetical protein